MAKAAPQMRSRPCRCCSALALLGMSQMRLPPAKHTNCHQHTASASTTKHSSCLTANNLNRSVGPALASYHIRASCRLFFFFFRLCVFSDRKRDGELGDQSSAEACGCQPLESFRLGHARENGVGAIGRLRRPLCSED